jgi:hypothetical protein
MKRILKMYWNNVAKSFELILYTYIIAIPKYKKNNSDTHLSERFCVYFISPHSNNAYKHAAPPGTIYVLNNGGAFQQKLTIIPVSLHAENKELDTSISPTTLSNSICMIKTATSEISFFNGVDERTIQTIIRELKHL